MNVAEVPRPVRRPLVRALLLAAAMLGAATSRAHDEWNNYHITYSAPTQFVYPFDGRTPKIAVALMNHHPTTSPETRYTLRVDGQPQAGAGFRTFPEGGNLWAPPDGFALATALTRGIYETPGITPPALGQTREYTFDFVFSLAPGVQPPAGQPHAPAATYTQTARVQFTNLGDTPVLSGPFLATGTVQLPPSATPGVPPNARAEVSTPYSNWFPVTLTRTGAGATETYSFVQALPARNDWHIRFTAAGYESRVVALGLANDPAPINVALTPAPPPQLSYRVAAAVPTPTGFWRGAVSESERSFVAFPGQETWRTGATESELRSLRTSARIYKYRFDGTLMWQHAPGWETWGGDMSADGRYVVYVLHPSAATQSLVPEYRIVVLDGASGGPLWSMASGAGDAAARRRMESVEVAISPDSRWIAVGTTQSGVVSLVDRATGTFVWTVPGSDTFGQVRRLRFSADNQFLYCGSGDSQVRKLRVSDGAVLWTSFAGGWPSVNGLDLTPDGAWLAAGSQSLDASVLRTSDGQIQWRHETQHVDAVLSPDGRHLATAGGQIYRTIDGSIAGMTKLTGVTRFTPDGRHLLQFENARLQVHDLGGNPLSATGLPGGIGATTPVQWIYSSQDGRTVVLLARDLAAPSQIGLVVLTRETGTQAAPTFATQPLSQTVAEGASTTLLVSATGTGPFTYQWRRNGTEIAGATTAALVIPNTAAADAGAYTVAASNAGGTSVSNAASLTVTSVNPANPGRLSNLAVRAQVGGTPLIVGFAIGGAGASGPKNLLIRGAGPSLTPLGVTAALLDPRIALYSGQAQLLGNDNWGGDAIVASTATQLGAFPFTAPTSRDAALTATAVSGNYTVQLSSVDGSAGTALAEIYDATPTFGVGTTRLINLSARTDIPAGSGTLIAGFVVSGSSARTVLVRAVGPALRTFGVTGALADPQLTLYRDSTVVAANDNWYDAPNALAISAAAAQVGAFRLPPASADAAVLITLPPGNYTAQATGGGAAGNTLVEVYELP